MRRACWTEHSKALARRGTLWIVVVSLWIGAFFVGLRSGSLLLAAMVVAINFELLGRAPRDEDFLEYVTSGFFCLLVFGAGYWSMPVRIGSIGVTSELSLIVTALAAALVNIRFQFASLGVLSRLLLLAAVAGFLFNLWQSAYVPKMALHEFSLALEFYRYWSKPIEMALVAGPFLFLALKSDIGGMRTGMQTSRVVDIYYSYALPLLCFGLYPGIGRGDVANCETTGTYVAIWAIIAVATCGIALSLVFNRRSILIASAVSATLLSVNRCVEVPILPIAFATAAAMLIVWRWLPKGRFRTEAPVSA